MQATMREIAFLAATREFEVYVTHIQGHKNLIPDALSRWHIADTYQDQFHKETANKSTTYVDATENMFKFTAEWC